MDIWVTLPLFGYIVMLAYLYLPYVCTTDLHSFTVLQSYSNPLYLFAYCLVSVGTPTFHFFLKNDWLTDPIPTFVSPHLSNKLSPHYSFHPAKIAAQPGVYQPATSAQPGLSNDPPNDTSSEYKRKPLNDPYERILKVLTCCNHDIYLEYRCTS